MLMKLVTVTSRTTLVARVIATVVFLVGFMVNAGWLSLETASAVTTWIQGPVAESVIVGIAMIVGAFAPSILGWASRDKELPDGVKITDVEIKPNAAVPMESRAKLERQQLVVAKESPSRDHVLPMFIFMAVTMSVLSACSCKSNSNYVPMSMAEQRAAGLCVVQPQLHAR